MWVFQSKTKKSPWFHNDKQECNIVNLKRQIFVLVCYFGKTTGLRWLIRTCINNLTCLLKFVLFCFLFASYKRQWLLFFSKSKKITHTPQRKQNLKTKPINMLFLKSIKPSGNESLMHYLFRQLFSLLTVPI